MLTIVCPNCTVSFRAPPTAIPALGRTLRCSSCGHQWHFTAPLEDPAALDIADLTPHEATPTAPFPTDDQSQTDNDFARILRDTAGDVNRPTPMPVASKTRIQEPKEGFFVRGRGARRGYVAALLVCGAIGGLVLTGQKLITGLQPRAQAIYDIIGMPPVLGEPNVIFRDLKVTQKGSEFILTGTLYNQDSMQQEVPPVRVGVMGEGLDPLTIWVFRAEAKYLDPNTGIPFVHQRSFDRPGEVTRLVLNLIEDVPTY